jgi:hypothetical protein
MYLYYNFDVLNDDKMKDTGLFEIIGRGTGTESGLKREARNGTGWSTVKLI